MTSFRPIHEYTKFVIFVLILFSSILSAQVPENNDPCPTDANPPIDLTSTGTHVGTTCEATFDYANVDCSADTQDASVWYTFTPNNGDDGYDITLSPSGGGDDAEGPITVEVYKGTTNQGCTGFSETLGSSCTALDANISIPNNFVSGEIIYVKVTTDEVENQCGAFSISIAAATCGEFADNCLDITGFQTLNPITSIDFEVNYTCTSGCLEYANPDPTATVGCDEFPDNPTVWFKVVVDGNGQQLLTTVETPGNWQPVWSIWKGDDCGNLTIMDSQGQTCSNEDVTPDLFQVQIDPLFDTYWIAVSVDPLSLPINGIDDGTFDICATSVINAIICLGDLEGDCAEPSLIFEITEREVPGGSLDGPFCPGEEVTVNVSFFFDSSESSSDWLSGFVPRFGPGWDITNFDYDANAPIGNGMTAQWYQENGDCAPLISETVSHLCTYVNEDGDLALCNTLCEPCSQCPNMGMTQGDPLPSGYFWVTNGGGADCENDCSPSEGWGIGSITAQVDWTFSIQVKEFDNYDDCFTNNDLQISFQSFSQGVVGCWEDPIGECIIDKSQFSPLWKVDCIVPPIILAENQELCHDGTTDIFVNTEDGSTNTIIVEVEDNPSVTGEMNHEFPGGAGTIADNLNNLTNSTQVVTYHMYAEDLSLTCPGKVTTIEVTVYPELIINLPPYHFACQGACTNIFPEVYGGAGSPYTYNWSTGETASFIEVCPTVPTTYSLTVEDALGCTDIYEVEVDVKPAVEFSVPENITVCKDGTFDPLNPEYIVCIDYINGSPPYVTNWSAGPGLIGSPAGDGECFIINEESSTEFAGILNLSATVTDFFGCTLQKDIMVEVIGELILAVEVVNLECGDTAATISFTGLDAIGNPMTTFLIYGGCPDIGLGDLLGEVSTFTGVGEYEVDLLLYQCFTIIGQTEQGCTISQNIEIPLIVGIPIDITGTPNICGGEEATISITNDSSYVSFNWTPDIGLTGSLTFIPDSSNTYFVEAIDADGCKVKAEFTVIVNPADGPLCADPCENQTSDYQITGIAYSDDNGNGMQDSGELPLPNVVIKDLENDFSVFTNAFGVYAIPINSGTVQLLASINEGDWINPEIEQNILVEIPCVEGVDFGFIPDEPLQAGNISVSNTITRCDWETKFYIAVENLDHDVINGKVVFTFDDETSFFVSNINGIQVSNNQATFETGPLVGFTPREFVITLKMPGGSSNLPELKFKAEFFNGDILIDTYEYTQQLRCSYDPNDKRTFPDRPGDENITLKDENIEYTLRFQNNGNDTAFHVRLIDILDPGIVKSSIRFINSSHPFDACLSGDTLIMDFLNINLVDSTTNYDASQGFISFSSEIDSTVAYGTEIHNSVDIIFDTNLPIVTNTTLNTIVEVLCTDVTSDTLVFICDGGSYMGFDSTGTYEIIMPTDLGCDSIINLTLDVNVPVQANFGPATICQGDVIEILGIAYQFDSSGTYTYEIEGPSGCIETILSVSIEVTETVEKFEQFTICEGDVLTYEDIVYEFDSSGIYDFEIMNELGCIIQILQFDITVISPATNYQQLAICEGIVVTFDDKEYMFDSTGVYTFFIEGESGCTEVELIFDITVNETMYIQTDTTICEGQIYEGFEISGVYEIETFDPLTGCLIINTLTLEVLPLSDPDCVTNTADFEIDNIKVYPIPTNETLIIESDYTVQEVSIYSSTGSLLTKMENQSSKRLKMDVSELPIGFHLIMVETNQGRVMKKVIISR